jgi:GAF domain-containing protein
MSPDRETPLVPLLLPGEESADAEILDTWHLALSNALSSDRPHDLLGVWLYPEQGGVALIAPAALAADQLTVPVPPDITPDTLRLLEEIITDAGYPSVIATPIRTGGRESGLLLFAALREGVYGKDERAITAAVAERLGPMFGRLGRRWGREPAVEGEAPRGDATSAATGAVAGVIAAAASPHDFARALRVALAPFVPADRLEILVPGTTADQWYRLGEHPGGPLWTDPRLIVSRASFDVPALFGVNNTVLLADAAIGPTIFPIPAEGESEPPVRAVVGVWLELAGKTVGTLLLGSAEAERYGETDVELLGAIAPLVAVRADGFVAAGHLQLVRSHLATLRAVPAHLGRLAEMLASIADSGEALRRFAAEAAGVVAFERLHFALSLTEEDRVAILAPGETRALPDLPLTPVAGTGLGRVVRGELPNLTVRAEQRSDLIVGLRVGGRVIGAMVFTGTGGTMFGRGDVEAAQRLADLVAPHLELLRRAAIAPPPMIPGWKRAPRF